MHVTYMYHINLTMKNEVQVTGYVKIVNWLVLQLHVYSLLDIYIVHVTCMHCTCYMHALPMLHALYAFIPR